MGRAGVFAKAQCFSHDVGEIGSVAQAHIEALGADWRHDMRGFADQRDAISRDLCGPLDRKREFVPARLDRGAAEDGVLLLLDGLRELLLGERHQPLGFIR